MKTAFALLAFVISTSAFATPPPDEIVPLIPRPSDEQIQKLQDILKKHQEELRNIQKQLFENCDIEKGPEVRNLNDNVQLVMSYSKKTTAPAVLFSKLASLPSVVSAARVMNEFAVPAEVAFHIIENTRAMVSTDARVIRAGGKLENLKPLDTLPCLRFLTPLDQHSEQMDREFFAPYTTY